MNLLGEQHFLVTYNRQHHLRLYEQGETAGVMLCLSESYRNYDVDNIAIRVIRFKCNLYLSKRENEETPVTSCRISPCPLQTPHGLKIIIG